ncbi:MAG: RpiB/LacA/LacB family sugar-phosphate isomerase [Candidatus Nanohaloarchaea archaeon]
MIVGLFADHAGHDLKEEVYDRLTGMDRDVEFRNYTEKEAGDDYPDVIDRAVDAYETGDCDVIMVFCGTGIGVSMAANRRGVRVARVCIPADAEMARKHNDAEGLAFGGRQMDVDTVVASIEAFLDAGFEGGRHQRRVDKI